MKFDELNQLRRFFSVMDIPKAEQEKRVAFADILYDALVFTFSVIKIENKVSEDISPATYETYKESLQNRLYDAFDTEGIPYDDEYIPKLATEIIDTTMRHPDEEYYLSQDRALLIAQNEANTAYNYMDYKNAVKEGMRYKTWITEADERVRPEHAEVDGMRVPIDEYFYVGDETLLFPHDYINGTAKNLINCRCVCAYE